MSCHHRSTRSGPNHQRRTRRCHSRSFAPGRSGSSDATCRRRSGTGHVRPAAQPQARRAGGPSDDSPVRERWVPSPMNTQPRQGRQNPSPHTNTAIRSILQSPKTPRNTKRLSRKAAKPRSRQGDRCRRSGIPLLPRVRSPPGLISPATSSPHDRPTAPPLFAASRAPPPARRSFSHRDAEPAEVGIPFITPLPVFDSAFTAFPDYQRVKKRSSALGTTFSDFARREFSECLRQGNPGSP
jgi:hypothetical protein